MTEAEIPGAFLENREMTLAQQIQRFEAMAEQLIARYIREGLTREEAEEKVRLLFDREEEQSL